MLLLILHMQNSKYIYYHYAYACISFKTTVAFLLFNNVSHRVVRDGI